MKLTEDKVKRLYHNYKEKGTSLQNKGKYNQALLYWKVAAQTAKVFGLDVYDGEIEEHLVDMSRIIIEPKASAIVNSHRCVFYDAHSRALGGLTQQYLRAIFQIGWDVLYITEVSPEDSCFQPILKELNDAENVSIVHVPQKLRSTEKAQFLYDTITRFAPIRMFMHMHPDSVHAVVAFNALPSSIEKFQIDYTDHAFWVGTSCTDYSFEFRTYGCNLSASVRGIDESKIFLLPFYPIETSLPFQGFPFNQEGKIIIFSGGSYYKVFDENDTYFKMCKAILEISPNVVIAYAGMGFQTQMEEKLETYGINERFFLIGERQDLSAVYDKCDIYLNTYPVAGGLMCQYAARHALPILSLYDGTVSKVEEVVCQIKEQEISSNSLESLIEKAHKLIVDQAYRHNHGADIARCCISPVQFRNAFVEAVKYKRQLFPYSIDKKFSGQRQGFGIKKMLISENHQKEYHRFVFKTLGWYLLSESPLMALDAFCSLFRQKRVLSALKNNLIK